jgi:hypothetical protein
VIQLPDRDRHAHTGVAEHDLLVKVVERQDVGDADIVAVAGLSELDLDAVSGDGSAALAPSAVFEIEPHDVHALLEQRPVGAPVHLEAHRRGDAKILNELARARDQNRAR